MKMKANRIKMLLLAIAAVTLSSCTTVQFKSAQAETHECYSRWHHLPANS